MASEGLAKQKTLHTLLLSLAPDMIMIQETMCSHYHAFLAFSKLLSRWELCDLDAVGLSGRLLLGWNPLSVRCNAFETSVRILVKERFRGSPTIFSILNCYGPYQYRDTFWKKVVDDGLLILPNLILAGDLNFTLNHRET